jgi:hypothetical protein
MKRMGEGQRGGEKDREEEFAGLSCIFSAA